MTNTLFILFRYGWVLKPHEYRDSFIIQIDSTQVKETCREGFDHTLPICLKPSQKSEISIIGLIGAARKVDL